MGANNKAFVVDYPYDDGVYWSYWHDYLGGSLEFDVDVSSIDCACAGGVFLAAIDDDECTWGAHADGTVPQCASVDIMAANKYGFQVESNPCTGGVCDASEVCKAHAKDGDEYAYGPGSEYTIDSTRFYSVKTNFVASNDDGNPGILQRIETILSQDGQQVTLEQSCDNMNLLTNHLEGYYGMAMAISTYNLGLENDISRGTCDSYCSNPTNVIKNVVWNEDDNIETHDEPTPDPNVTIINGGPSWWLDEEGCGSNCSECRWFYEEGNISGWWNECVDDRVMRYTDTCSSSDDINRCSEWEDHCFWSYPADDPDAASSSDYACRTVPDSYQGVIGTDYDYSSEVLDSSSGLCYSDYDCTCHMSWPMGSTWADPKTMARCLE